MIWALALGLKKSVSTFFLWMRGLIVVRFYPKKILIF